MLGVGFLVLFLTAGVVIYAAPHFGWRIDAVRSNSMAPEKKRGALVIAQPVKPESILLNDIIIFQPVGVGENLLCHRVVTIEHNSPLQFLTKGDAYAAADPYPVPAQNVAAKVIYHVPVLGYAILFLKTPVGFLVTLLIPGITVTFMCLSDIVTELRRRKREIPASE